MTVAPLVVLESVQTPGKNTNPYVVQLVEAMREQGVEVSWFSWRRGLLGRYDVLHVHWPEVMVRRVGRLQRWAALARFALLMGRMQLRRRTLLVRTLHNRGAHEGGGRVETFLLAWCTRRTDHWIALNDEIPAERVDDATVIPHGDYTTWFARRDVPASIPGRFLYFGLIRPYKGVDALLGAFGALTGPDVSLRVVGQPSGGGLRELIEAEVVSDPRVGALLQYVDDETLALEVGSAELVVLPYRDMYNSGALLLALSLGRPALVPSSAVTEALAKEVGDAWVTTYEGELTPQRLTQALAEVQAMTGAGPDLSARTWDRVAAAHVDLFRSLGR